MRYTNSTRPNDNAITATALVTFFTNFWNHMEKQLIKQRQEPVQESTEEEQTTPDLPITSESPTVQSDHLNPPNDHTETETRTETRQKRNKNNNSQATGDKKTTSNNLELLMKEIMTLMTKIKDYTTTLHKSTTYEYSTHRA